MITPQDWRSNVIFGYLFERDSSTCWQTCFFHNPCRHVSRSIPFHYQCPLFWDLLGIGDISYLANNIKREKFNLPQNSQNKLGPRNLPQLELITQHYNTPAQMTRDNGNRQICQNVQIPIKCIKIKRRYLVKRFFCCLFFYRPNAEI